VVPGNEGNEVNREGRQGVGVPHCTKEVGEPTPGDPAEGKGHLGMELLEGKMRETSGSQSVSTKLQRIAELARQAPKMAMTTLSHHFDEEFLKEAYRRTRKDGAVGVDGQTAQEYEANLDENLSSLKERFKSGSYKAPPVRRVYIPKAGNSKKLRPIGIPSLEDKVLQRAVSMVLETVYEQDFLDCSYGFRPKRSAHDALATLWSGLMGIKGGWVIEMDIKGCYDNISRPHLRSFLDQRVRDGVIRRTIDKWLKAGVLEDGEVWHPTLGTPQGGVVSPVLMNVFLHEALDKWFEEVVKPRMKGKALMIRYADDAVLAFEMESDARRVMEVLPKRFLKYGLELHEEKTRLIDFRRPGPTNQRPTSTVQAGRASFDFLGFCHHWGKSRKGYQVIKRKTAKERLRRAIVNINEWCRRNRHIPAKDQWSMLVRKLQGHYGYYGITGNIRALSQFHRAVTKAWQKWLNRRSQRKDMPWERFIRMLERYKLPTPKVVHSIYGCAAKP